MKKNEIRCEFVDSVEVSGRDRKPKPAHSVWLGGKYECDVVPRRDEMALPLMLFLRKFELYRVDWMNPPVRIPFFGEKVPKE